MRRTWRTAAAAVLLLGTLGACGGGGGGGTEDAATTELDPRPPAGADSPDCPVRNHLAVEFEGRRRNGITEPVDYAFLQAREGGCQPVRFNPCEPIRYVVNGALAPPGALDDLQEALRRVEAATGLTFVNDGPTDEPGANSRPRFQPERYGNRWAPVLIVWDHGSKYRMDINNPGGGRSFAVDGVWVSGVVILNADAVVANGFGSGPSWGRVLIHELGHLVGLGHVARSDQIMFAEVGVQTGDAAFHAGDLVGLRLVGKDAGCLQTPAPPPAPR